MVPESVQPWSTIQLYTQKAVHTQGGTHKRRSVATARVMLLKGPQAGRYTQKAEHTKGGLCPP